MNQSIFDSFLKAIGGSDRGAQSVNVLDTETIFNVLFSEHFNSVLDLRFIGNALEEKILILESTAQLLKNKRAEIRLYTVRNVLRILLQDVKDRCHDFK